MAPSSDRPSEAETRRKRPGRLEQAISNPGTVKINVTGAFIVDDEYRARSPLETDGVHYENKDIRLPHHTGVVSHVAVDVSRRALLFRRAPRTATELPAIRGRRGSKISGTSHTDSNGLFRLEDH